MGKPKMNVRVPKYQAVRDKKIREVRKRQGKAQQHKERVAAVTGAARSKKSQRRIAHKQRMLEKDAAAKAGGDAAMDDAPGAAVAAARAAGKAGKAVGKKQKLRIKRKAGAKGGGGGAAPAAAAEAGDEMQQ